MGARERPAAIAAAFTVAAGVLSAWASWRTWIVPFVDSSREMNVPVRLLAGERLYRDVAYYYGPAGPWLEAIGIALGGRRFAALEAVGLLAAVLLLGSLAVLAGRAGSRLSAGAACIWAAAVCIGAPNGGSFLFPYSFGALFALAGAFLALAAAAGPASRLRNGIAAAGLALALASRPEVGVGALALLLAVALRAPVSVRRAEVRRAAAITLGGSAAAVAAWAVALAGVPAAALFPEGFLALLSPPAEWRNVYRAISGLADPAAGVNAVATALFLDLAILGAAAILGSARAGRRPRAVLGVACLVVALGTAALCAGPGARVEDALPGLLAPMPIVTALACLLWFLRAPVDPGGRARLSLSSE